MNQAIAEEENRLRIVSLLESDRREVPSALRRKEQCGLSRTPKSIGSTPKTFES